MIKMTIPQSILIGAVVIAMAIIWRVDETPSLVSEAKAEVAGMDAYDLRYDWDFKRAVRYIVEDCSVNGYVEDGYIDNASIAC